MESSSRVNVSNPSASKKATSIASAITSFASPISDRRSARAACLVLIALACTLSGASGRADDAASRAKTAQLQERLGRLEARDDAKYAKGALEHARRALSVATGDPEDPGAVSRQQQIARAAMVLAERQLERRRAQAELFATQRRLTATRERANAQRRALEALMRDRAAIAREGVRP
jgi:hypothetical protein